MRNSMNFQPNFAAGFQHTIAAVIFATIISCTLPALLHAQRGGGMGGIGGMSGGSSRGGGRGGSRGGATEQNPSGAVKDNLKKNDLIAFVLDHKKPLKITDQQSDTLKAYRKEMLYTQEPVFKEMDKVYAEMRGGARGRGGYGASGSGAGNGDARAGDFATDTVRTLIAKLNDIQDAYRDRAKLKLDATQVHLADSLQTAYMAEQRDKEAKASSRRRDE